MALSIDIAPTLLDIAGLGPDPAVQGRSLVPVLRQDARQWRSSFLVEYFTDTVFPRIRNMGYVAVRTDRYKYIQYRELSGMNELYDLRADPYEETNIIDRPDSRPTLQADAVRAAAPARGDEVPVQYDGWPSVNAVGNRPQRGVTSRVIPAMPCGSPPAAASGQGWGRPRCGRSSRR